jgi:hypothetical protein
MSSISAAIFALCSRFEIGNGSTWPSVLTYDEVEEAERREILARGFVLLIARAAVTRRCMHGEERGGGGGTMARSGLFCGEVPEVVDTFILRRKYSCVSVFHHTVGGMMARGEMHKTFVQVTQS